MITMMYSPSLPFSVVRGCGGYLPDRVISNHEFAKTLETSHEWIVERTGIHQRHFVAQGQTTTDLAYEAAQKALASARISPQDLDLIVVATITPERTFPSTAALLQGRLGNTKALAFDVAGACGGFILGLNVVHNFLTVGQARYALVVGADAMSTLLDMNDRRTCVLFGDGAAAVVLESIPASSRTQEEQSRGPQGIWDIHLQSDGQFAPILWTDGGVSLNQKAGVIHMQGQEVYRHAVTKMADSAQKILDRHHLTAHDVDWFVPHQANARIIDSVAQRLCFPPEKIILTVDQHANTSAASIPLALWVGIEDGRLQTGDVLLLEALGGGLIWGSALLKL